MASIKLGVAIGFLPEMQFLVRTAFTNAAMDRELG